MIALLTRWAGEPDQPVDSVHAMSAGGRVLVAIVTAGILFFLLRLVRRGQLRGKYAILWLAVGFGLVGFALYPDILVPISDAVGISYEPAIIFLAGIAFLFIVVVHFSYELSRLEDRTRALAEEIALLRGERESESEETASGA